MGNRRKSLSSLKIAFTGAHGVGKDTFVKLSKELLGDVASVDVLDSSTRHIIDLTGNPYNEQTSDWTQLWSAVQRRFWEFEWKRNSSLGNYNSKSHSVLLSARCGLDEVAYQGVWFARQYNLFSSKMSNPIMGPDNQPIFGPELAQMQALLKRSESTLHVLLEQALYEVTEFWDIVYFKRATDFPIEADGLRSSDKEFQEHINRQMELTLEGVPVLKQKVRFLPDDFEQAKDFLRRESEEWISFLTKPSLYIVKDRDADETNEADPALD